MNKLFFISAVLFLLSCKKYENEIGGTVFDYNPQTTEYMSIYNYYLIDVGVETGNSEFNNTYIIEPLENNIIKSANYVLNISIESFTKEMMEQEGFDPEDYLTDRDINMEQQIGQYLSRIMKSRSSSIYTNLMLIDYMQDEIKNIKISSTKKLFGIEAGELLNNKVEIAGTPAYQSFLFTYNKELIGKVEKGWNIDKYLSYRPIASKTLYFRFPTTLPEAPIETQFIVELEMADGRTLKDTTELVNLLP